MSRRAGRTDVDHHHESRRARGAAPRVTLAAGIALASLGVGCSEGYVLRGRVVEADVTHIEIVEPGDPRLASPGVPGATLSLTLEPGRLDVWEAGREFSDGSGDFAIPVSEFGAGVWEVRALMDASADGFEGAERFFDLPPGDQRVLVRLARERGGDAARGDAR